MIRKALINDIENIITLLSEAFEMSVEDTRRLLDMVQPFENTFVLFKDNEVISTASAIPFNEGEKKGRYIYAVATKSEHRKKGYAGELLKFILNFYNDIDVALLKPATETLFDYYRKIGFDKEINASFNQYSNPKPIMIDRCNIEEYFLKRMKYNSFSFENNVCEYYIKEYSYKAVCIKDTIALYRIDNNICYIDEIYGSLSCDLVCGILYKEKTEKAIVTDRGNEPFALAHHYGEEFLIDFRIPME